jgi:hypothetical protein
VWHHFFFGTDELMPRSHRNKFKCGGATQVPVAVSMRQVSFLKSLALFSRRELTLRLPFRIQTPDPGSILIHVKSDSEDLEARK